MSLFAIKIYEFGVGDKFYVGEDERLWEWLTSDENLLGLPPLVEAALGEDFIRVLCPEGYVFYNGMLVPLESNLAIYPPKPVLSDFALVSESRSNIDKVLLLILNPYTKVTRLDEAKFNALGLRDDRIFEVTLGI